MKKKNTLLAKLTKTTIIATLALTSIPVGLPLTNTTTVYANTSAATVHVPKDVYVFSGTALTKPIAITGVNGLKSAHFIQAGNSTVQNLGQLTISSNKIQGSISGLGSYRRRLAINGTVVKTANGLRATSFKTSPVMTFHVLDAKVVGTVEKTAGQAVTAKEILNQVQVIEKSGLNLSSIVTKEVISPLPTSGSGNQVQVRLTTASGQVKNLSVTVNFSKAATQQPVTQPPVNQPPVNQAPVMLNGFAIEYPAGTTTAGTTLPKSYSTFFTVRNINRITEHERQMIENVLNYNMSSSGRPVKIVLGSNGIYKAYKQDGTIIEEQNIRLFIKQDTDGDQVPDYMEIERGTNPHDAKSYPEWEMLAIPN
ncbi:TPA: hypothetical protein ACGOU9_000759 [Streptococcus suis]